MARNIVKADRSARKYGVSQNTICEIERASVAAFMDGRANTNSAEKTGDTKKLTWIQIPPRSRDKLQSMTFGFSKLENGAGVKLVPTALERSIRWRMDRRARSLVLN